jgi:hypothetical protein
MSINIGRSQNMVQKIHTPLKHRYQLRSTTTCELYELKPKKRQMRQFRKYTPVSMELCDTAPKQTNDANVSASMENTYSQPDEHIVSNPEREVRFHTSKLSNDFVTTFLDDDYPGWFSAIVKEGIIEDVYKADPILQVLDVEHVRDLESKHGERIPATAEIVYV